MSVLIPLRRLLRRERGATRRAEVAELRRRFRDVLPDVLPTAAVVAAAERLLTLKPELLATLSDVESCDGCAAGHPLPAGRWAGGHCCSGKTHELFADRELAALRLAGVSLRGMAGPDSDHAGCAFRGPTGCSLAVKDRPMQCVRYTCRQLESELRSRDRLGAVRDLQAQMTAAMAIVEEWLDDA